MLGSVNLYVLRFIIHPVPILYKLYSIIRMLVDHSMRLCDIDEFKTCVNIIFELAAACRTSFFFLLLYRNREVQNATTLCSISPSTQPCPLEVY